MCIFNCQILNECGRFTVNCVFSVHKLLKMDIPLYSFCQYGFGCRYAFYNKYSIVCNIECKHIHYKQPTLPCPLDLSWGIFISNYQPITWVVEYFDGKSTSLLESKVKLETCSCMLKRYLEGLWWSFLYQRHTRGDCKVLCHRISIPSDQK